MNKTMSNQIKHYKVILIGDSGVGKTSIVKRLKYPQCAPGELIKNIFPTEGSSFTNKIYRSNSINICFDLWDISGDSKYDIICRPHYNKCNFCLCVFDLSNRESFENINQWINKFKEDNKFPNVIYIVANKYDLPKSCWQITFDELQFYSNKIGIDIFYSSAHFNEGIEELFQILVEKTVGMKCVAENKSCQLIENETSKQKIPDKDKIANGYHENTTLLKNPNTDIGNCWCQ